jgi:hypothetical protein
MHQNNIFFKKLFLDIHILKQLKKTKKINLIFKKKTGFTIAKYDYQI